MVVAPRRMASSTKAPAWTGVAEHVDHFQRRGIGEARDHGLAVQRLPRELRIDRRDVEPMLQQKSHDAVRRAPWFHRRADQSDPARRCQNSPDCLVALPIDGHGEGAG